MFNFFLPSTAAGQFTLIAGASIALLAVASIFYRRLQEQNRRLSTALNNMSQGLNMFDAQGRIILLNKRYLQMYKLSPDKPAGTQRNDRGRASGRGRKRFRRCRFRGQIACSANRQGDRRHSQSHSRRTEFNLSGGSHPADRHAYAKHQRKYLSGRRFG
jgi:PAS domain-containing protein